MLRNRLQPGQTIRRGIGIAGLMVSLLSMTGCEGNSEDGISTDVGSNNPGVIVALGDSITDDGRGLTPWPALMTGYTGRQVVNAGKGGDRANGGASRVGGLLRAHQPGYLLIFLGSNDAIHGADPNAVKASLGSIIASARANQTVPVLATIPPMITQHRIFQGSVLVINAAIRALASEEGVHLVDLESAFNSDPDAYLDSGGLHPNQAGQDLIARRFSGLF